jgi:MerR family copper efflux transcriptional regulator
MAIRIGELARRAGIATSALRYYDSEGLLGPAARTEAGYRLYQPQALGRVRFIQRAKRLGLPLTEIRRLIESPLADAGAQRDALRHLVAHRLAEAQAQTAELQALSRELESLHMRLQRLPATDYGHIGDCEFWLPTDEEVRMMQNEVNGTQCCTCEGCDQPGQCDCDCDCCGS